MDSLLGLMELEELRGNPALLFAAALDDEVVPVLYECLRIMGRMERLDLVLGTTGGDVTATRRIALLLREYVEHLTILVPHRARSAGTLLCLSANDLVLGPLAELGPIDAHVGAVGATPADAPGMISGEDVRLFAKMAEDWFGVTRPEDRLQVLALVAQRIFPTSLTSFYRFDMLTHEIAEELLTFQLPDMEQAVRRQVVDKLVNGYNSHSYTLSRHEARKLGLRVLFASDREEELLWSLRKVWSARMYPEEGPSGKELLGLVAGGEFLAQLERCDDRVPKWKFGGSKCAAP